jgi:hypothetical protein
MIVANTHDECIVKNRSVLNRSVESNKSEAFSLAQFHL